MVRCWDMNRTSAGALGGTAPTAGVVMFHGPMGE